ncbi:SRPBCC domain-containing protein [Escherichia coli]
MPIEAPELTIARFIDAPPALVWKAWTTPEHLAKWWIPAPSNAR